MMFTSPLPFAGATGTRSERQPPSVPAR
jgi:hypothetical protein